MRHFALMTLAVLLAAVPTASAQDSNAPPGNSGVDQYLESVPSGSGSTSSNGVAAAKPGRPSTAVAKTLRSRGTAGAELERLVASTAPGKGAGGTGGSAPKAERGRSRQSSNTSPSAQSGSRSGAIAATAAAATGSGGGMGAWLPVLLGVAALAAIVALAVRFARKSPS